jgi:hypothetical protein
MANILSILFYPYFGPLLVTSLGVGVSFERWGPCAEARSSKMEQVITNLTLA